MVTSPQPTAHTPSAAGAAPAAQAAPAPPHPKLPKLLHLCHGGASHCLTPRTMELPPAHFQLGLLPLSTAQAPSPVTLRGLSSPLTVAVTLGASAKPR